MPAPNVWRRLYCRRKGESRHREASQLNMADRLNQTMRGEKGRESKRGSQGQETKRRKWLSYIGIREQEENRKPRPPRGLGKGVGCEVLGGATELSEICPWFLWEPTLRQLYKVPPV